jgi:hypothetical protein
MKDVKVNSRRQQAVKTLNLLRMERSALQNKSIP